MRISVILPIYKVANYIGDCIISLSTQTFSDFEVVLVDDGSPDNSTAIAEDICKNNNLQYQIIRQENQGVSAARNRGIENAKGEYVVMIDSDDVVTPTFLETLLSNTDDSKGTIVFCDFKIVSEENKFENPQKNFGVDIYNPQKAQELFLYHKVKFLLPTLFAKKEFLIKHNVWFDEKVRYSEDVQFIWKALAVATKIVYVNSDMYNYFLHGNSTMTSSGIQKIMTGFDGVDKVYDEFYRDNDNVSVTVKKEFISSWKFAALHGSAKMLDFESFITLYNNTGINKQKRLFMQNPNFKIKIISLILFLSKSFGYKIFRKY